MVRILTKALSYPFTKYVTIGNVYHIVYKIIHNYVGRRFNDPMLKDNYPKGIKGEPKLSDLITQLKDTNISYVFGQVGLDLVKGELAVLLEREKYQSIFSFQHLYHSNIQLINF